MRMELNNNIAANSILLSLTVCNPSAFGTSPKTGEEYAVRL